MTADRFDCLVRRAWSDDDVPPGVRGIPTMLSKSGRRKEAGWTSDRSIEQGRWTGRIARARKPFASAIEG